MRFIIDDPEDQIQKFLIRGQFYEADKLAIMKQYCPPDATILDIGANVGNHAVYFSKHFSAKEIIVFEPIPRAYKLLLANLCLNYCHNVNVDFVGLALGHGNFTGYPYGKFEKNLGSVSISSTVMPESEYEPVEIVAGDDLLKDKKVDFIKMDIEGMEMWALKGLKETIDRCRPNIYIEVDGKNYKEFDEWVKENKYRIVWRDSYFDVNSDYMLVS